MDQFLLSVKKLEKESESIPALVEAAKNGSKLEQASTAVLLAYALQSNVFLLRRTLGLPTAPQKKAIRAIKPYMDKIAELSKSKRSDRIDKEAAKRFISHELKK